MHKVVHLYWYVYRCSFCSSTLVSLKRLLLRSTIISLLFTISVSFLGYRIRLGSSTDKKDTGRLHVDFAQARDDLYEWECRQRMLAREERHRRKMEEDRLRPPSPPPIVHYSEHECGQLGDKIKGRHGCWQSVKHLQWKACRIWEHKHKKHRLAEEKNLSHVWKKIICFCHIVIERIQK